MEALLKTSEEWQTLCRVEVLGPDGWDRRNFQFSWYEELITREEFEKRLEPSTVKFDPLLSPQRGGSIWNDVMFKYSMRHWKLIFHLLFRTYRFGVDNKWWADFDSIFGLPWAQRWHLLREYRAMRFRANSCYFVKEPWHWRKLHSTK